MILVFPTFIFLSYTSSEYHHHHRPEYDHRLRWKLYNKFTHLTLNSAFKFLFKVSSQRRYKTNNITISTNGGMSCKMSLVVGPGGIEVRPSFWQKTCVFFTPTKSRNKTLILLRTWLLSFRRRRRADGSCCRSSKQGVTRYSCLPPKG